MAKPVSHAAASRRIRLYEIFALWIIFQFAASLFVRLFLSDTQNHGYVAVAITGFGVLLLSKLVTRRDGTTLKALMGGFSRHTLHQCIFVTFVAVLLSVGCWALSVLVHSQVSVDIAYQQWQLIERETFDGIDWLPGWIAIHLLSGVVIVPIMEELLFRGFLLQRLREKMNTPAAIILSSLIFALFHFNKGILGAFVTGVLFATLTIRTRSLYAPILAHGIFNLIVTLLRLWGGVGLVAERDEIANFRYWLPELFALTAGLVLWAYYGGLKNQAQA